MVGKIRRAINMEYITQDYEMMDHSFKKLYNNKIGNRMYSIKSSILLYVSCCQYNGEVKFLTSNKDIKYLFSVVSVCYTRYPVEVPLKGCW